MRLWKLIVERKLVILLLTVCIGIFGVYSFQSLSTELVPEVALDGATVEVAAKKMSIYEMEEKIQTPLEQAFQDVAGVKATSSSTTAGHSRIDIEFENGQGNKSFPKIETKTNAILAQDIPVDMVKINQNGDTTAYEFILDVSGSDRSSMSSFAINMLQPRLEGLKEVNDVMFTGLEVNQVSIQVNRDKVMEEQVDMKEVIETIQNLNQDIHIGNVGNQQAQTDVYWNSPFSDKKELEDMQIQTDKGFIPLKEIADISLTPAPIVADTWKDGSSDLIMVQIARAQNVSQKEMTEAVRHEIDKIKAEEPDTGITINEVIAHADFVHDSMNDVKKNIIIGGIIAVLVLLVFLRNIRATVIVGISIPTSILLTMILMKFYGYSLNLLTLIGLGLGIGMMVDASIVILEAIYRKKQQGLSQLNAVMTGTKEVAGAIIASVLTTIVVFLPLGFVNGDTGQYMAILAIVISTTLISSMIIAFTLIPALAHDFMKVASVKEGQRKTIFLRYYKRLVAWCIRKKGHSAIVIAIFIVLFTGSLFLMPGIPMKIMPDIFERYTEVAIDLEKDVTEEEKKNIIQKANQALTSIDDIEANYLLDYDDRIMASIVMTKGEKVTKEQEKVTEEILEQLRQLQKTDPIRAVERNLDGVSGYPVEIRISGEDYQVLHQIAQDLENDLNLIDGISSIAAPIVNEDTNEQINFKEDAMEEFDVSKQQIKAHLEALLLDTFLGQVSWKKEDLAIHIGWKDAPFTKKELLQSTIQTKHGEKRLGNFITLQKTSFPNDIQHQNGERYLSLFADIEAENTGEVKKAVQDVVGHYSTDANYSVSVAGDLEEEQQLMNDMLLVLGIAMLLVFIVMAIQFNHIGQPFIVMSIIPVAVIGVLIGLFLTQAELNFMSGMGLVILIGIVLNNAILIIDRTNQIRKTGGSVYDALMEAGESRVRPIFMTTLTTIGGMLPLALASGMSADYQAPLAIVIISGLLFSTCITLFLIPAIYRLFSKG